MNKILGIGGLFFRAKDPVALKTWYTDVLGIVISDYVWQQEAGPTVFEPFPMDTDHFSFEKQWMINFRVRDLDKMAAQLRTAGTKVEIDPETYPNGRFASLHDPDGNPIQLWQPEDKKPG